MRTLGALAILCAAVLVGSSSVAWGETLSTPALTPAVAASEIPPPGPYTGPGTTDLPPGMQLFADDVHKQCGKYALVFRNKDLREGKAVDLSNREDDFIFAQGTFFIQFQAVGAGSSEVVKFSFSFGATTFDVNNNPSLNCNEAIPDNPLGKGMGGAYLLYYRSDFDARDGFFVPIRTLNVPDGEYGAAVHAYNAAGNEVARAWARAKVDNCATDIASGVSALGCTQDTAESIIAKDHTLPWPMVLPGDGDQTNKENGQLIPGLTVEFPEPMINETVEVYLNGEQVPLEAWTPPARDGDLIPYNDDANAPIPCPLPVPPPAPNQVRVLCERIIYGPGWKWLGEVKKGDVLRVRGEDRNFNLLERTIHVGAATSGGTVESETPELALEVLNDDDVFIRPGDHHEFNVRVSNIGGGDADVGLLVNITREEDRPMASTYVEAYWTNLAGDRIDGLTLLRGEEVTLKVRVETDDSTPEDHYYVNGILEYDVLGQQQYKSFEAIVDVNQEASGNHQHLHDQGLLTNTTTESAGPLNNTKSGEGSPGAGVALAVGAAAVGVLLARRRRED